MDQIRRRMNSLRRPSEAPTLSPATYIAPSISAPLPASSLSNIDAPSLDPRRTPPGVKNPMTAIRGPPSEMTLAKLPAGRAEHRNATPFYADLDPAHLVVGGGVAIFHLATSRVVLCWHSRDHYWFLPKGRRDAGEDSRAGAEREGFEESGFRNRLLPLTINHRQPTPAGVTLPLPPLPGSKSAVASPSAQWSPRFPSEPAHPPMTMSGESKYTTEAILTQFLPVTRTRQYMLQWFIAETLPAGAEARVNAAVSHAAQLRRLDDKQVYMAPPAWPQGLTLRARVEQDWAAGGDGQPIQSKNPNREVTDPVSSSMKSHPHKNGNVYSENFETTSPEDEGDRGFWDNNQMRHTLLAGATNGPVSNRRLSDMLDKGTRHVQLPRTNVPSEALSKHDDEALLTPSKLHPRPYEPVHHLNTGVDAEEALYISELVPVEEAVRRLDGSGMELVVRWGWELICRRWAEEEKEDADSDDYVDI